MVEGLQSVGAQKTPLFPRGKATFKGLGAARGSRGSRCRKEGGITFKNGAQKLVSETLACKGSRRAGIP